MKLTNTLVAVAAVHVVACQPKADDASGIAELEAHLVEIERLFSDAYRR